MPNYCQEFQAAMERSTKFGLNVPNYKIDSNFRWLNDKRITELTSIVKMGIDTSKKDVYAQCLAIHLKMLPIISDYLGCPIFFTIGWLDDSLENKKRFYFDEVFIIEKLKNGYKENTINIHAWLTLPSMEIIDIVYLTTQAIIRKIPPKFALKIVAKHADESIGIKYKPTLVGEDFLRKIGILFDC